MTQAVMQTDLIHAAFNTARCCYSNNPSTGPTAKLTGTRSLDGSKILDFRHTYNTNGIDDEMFSNSSTGDRIININEHNDRFFLS